MLKFKGKPHELKAFIKSLVDKFGAKATIKEIIKNGGK